MRILRVPGRAARAPRWARGARIAERTVLVVIILALLVDAITLITAGAALQRYLGLVITAAGVAALRRWPLPAMLLIAAGPVADAILGREAIALWSVGCFAAFLLTMRGLSGVVTGCVIGVGNVAAVWIATGVLNPAVDPTASVAGFAAVVGTAVGSAVYGNLQYATQLEQRAHDAIESRQTAVERSVAEERVRIAQDLHDSVGHQIAVVSMRIGAAEVNLRAAPSAAQAELEGARAAVQGVLKETQQILRVLRGATSDSAVDPVPDHRRIPELIGTFQGAGLVVEATVADLDCDLTPSTSSAVYRIVQEALTNAHRHGTGSVSLTVAIDADAITVQTVNVRRDKDEDATAGGGNGLIGMRERAASAGGTVTADADGPLFWVRADLPTTSKEKS